MDMDRCVLKYHGKWILYRCPVCGDKNPHQAMYSHRRFGRIKIVPLSEARKLHSHPEELEDAQVLGDCLILYIPENRLGIDDKHVYFNTQHRTHICTKCGFHMTDLVYFWWRLTRGRRQHKQDEVRDNA